MRPALDFGPAPARIPLPVVSPRKRTRRRRKATYNPATITLLLPPIPGKTGEPRLLDDERRWMTEKTLHLLAYRYVQLHGHKYAIDKEEQEAILMLKMVSMIASGAYDYRRSQFSTLCYGTAFPRVLLREAMARHGHVADMTDAKSEPIDDYQEPQGELEEAELKGFVDKLPKRRRRILRMRFGIGCDAMTLGAIAAVYGKKTAWVKKEIAAALDSLRAEYGEERERESA